MKNSYFNRFYKCVITLILIAFGCLFSITCDNPMEQFAWDVFSNYPDIKVRVETTEIKFEDEYSFGSMIADGNDNYATSYITFFIENNGSKQLTISSLAVSLTDYDKSSFLSTNIGPGETTSFDMRFDPLSTGAKDAVVSIKSNKTGEGAFTFTVKGTGTVIPPRSVLINDFDACTDSTSVNLTINGGTDPVPDNMWISNDSGFTLGGWQTYSTSVSGWPLDSGAGTKTVYIKFEIASVPTSTYTDTIVLDTTAPSVPTIPNLSSIDDSGTSLSDNITRYTTSLTFYGTSEAYASIELYSGGTTLEGTGTADAYGFYSIDASLSAGVYSISARAIDCAGNYSSQSSGLSVTIDTTGPGIPGLLKPIQGENTGYDLTPTFSWAAVSGANYYKLQVDNNNTFLSPEIYESSLSSTTFTPSTSLAISTAQPYGTRYYFRVCAYDYAGNVSSWSSTPMRYVNVGRYNSDFNGDGYSDIIVGSSGSQYVYIYYGGSSFNTAADVSLYNTAIYFGRSTASVGDFNGDGYCDAVVGAYGYDGTYTNSGRAYLYLGSAAMNPYYDIVITGLGENYYFGKSVNSAGDVNGDGYADLIVGAYGYNSAQGRAYIYLGSATLNSIADLVLTGSAVSDYFGYNVSGAGDVNGDGYSDVIVGAYGNASFQGQSYIYLGGAALNSVADVTMSGPSASSYFGLNNCGAGDVNNDGYSDVVVGAYRYNSYTGAAYVYLGGSAMNSTADAVMTGLSANSYFGSCVTGAGDINNDGYSDILIGAYGYSSLQGQSYLYMGAATINSTLDYTPTVAVAGIQYGYSVAGGGDINHDGYDEFIVGARCYNTDYGRVYIYTGSNPVTTGWDYAIMGLDGSYFGYSIGKSF